MSEFSKYLNYLIKCRNLKHVQVAEMCKIDISIIFRWANGKVLPKSWTRLEPLVRRLRLTPGEVSALRDAYRREALGESQSQCFDEIIKTLHILAQKRAQGKARRGGGAGFGTVQKEGDESLEFGQAQKEGKESLESGQARKEGDESLEFGQAQKEGKESLESGQAQKEGKESLESGQAQKEEEAKPGWREGNRVACGLNGKIEIWQAIRQALSASPAHGGRELYLKLHGISESLLMELESACRNKHWQKINLLLCESSKAAKQTEAKLRRMQEVVELLFQKGEICISCLDASEGSAWEGHNWILTDDFFLQFTDDMSYGMLTGDRDWIAFFREQFGRLGEKCRPICKNTIDAMAYVERGNTEEGIQIMALEYMPCVSLGLTEDILQEQIHADVPFREEFIQRVIANYPQGASAVGQLFSYFTREGLIEFMESGRMDMFPYQGFYSPASLRQRCKILENIIALAEENPAIHFIQLKEDFLDLKGIHLEQSLGAKPSLWIELQPETGPKEEIAIVDKDIQQAYSRFFAYLKKGGKSYGEAETLARMKDVLDFYGEGNGSVPS